MNQLAWFSLTLLINHQFILTIEAYDQHPTSDQLLIDIEPVNKFDVFTAELSRDSDSPDQVDFEQDSNSSKGKTDPRCMGQFGFESYDYSGGGGASESGGGIVRRGKKRAQRQKAMKQKAARQRALQQKKRQQADRMQSQNSQKSQNVDSLKGRPQIISRLLSNQYKID